MPSHQHETLAHLSRMTAASKSTRLAQVLFELMHISICFLGRQAPSTSLQQAFWRSLARSLATQPLRFFMLAPALLEIIKNSEGAIDEREKGRREGEEEGLVVTLVLGCRECVLILLPLLLMLLICLRVVL